MCCQSLEVREQAPEVSGAEGRQGDSDQISFRWLELGGAGTRRTWRGAGCPTQTQTQTRFASPGRADRRHLIIPRPWSPRSSSDLGPVVLAKQPGPRGAVGAAEALLAVTTAEKLRTSPRVGERNGGGRREEGEGVKRSSPTRLERAGSGLPPPTLSRRQSPLPPSAAASREVGTTGVTAGVRG